MNWKQLHASATPEERLEMLTHMLSILEARPQQVFTGRRWVRDRRRGYKAHFLNDRRTGRYIIQRFASLFAFVSVFMIVSTATLSIALHAPLEFSGPVLFFYATSLMGVVLFKPRRFASLQI